MPRLAKPACTGRSSSARVPSEGIVLALHARGLEVQIGDLVAHAQIEGFAF